MEVFVLYCYVLCPINFKFQYHSIVPFNIPKDAMLLNANIPSDTHRDTQINSEET